MRKIVRFAISIMMPVYIAGNVSADEEIEVARVDDKTFIPYFSTGPTCRMEFAILHVYDVENEHFLSGEQIPELTPEVAEYIRDRSNNGQQCSSNVDLEALGNALNVELDLSQGYIMFFLDAPGSEPFPMISEEARERRDRIYEMFKKVGINNKVWIPLPVSG